MQTPLTPEQIAAIRANLADAQKAYHSLLTGNMARVIVDQNGERVEFTAAKSSDLYAYIQSLLASLVEPGYGCVPNGPVRFLF